ncbi:MAG: ABC transporter ATP-binding protein [Planctomycetota bacterium]
MSEPILETRGLGRTFAEGGRELRVLDGVDTSIAAGEKLAILGRSGSGKSTLLHLIGGLDTPTDGQVLFRGADLHGLTEPQIDAYRRKHVGLVFQFYHLLPELSAVENVLIGGLIADDGRTKHEVKQRAEALLGRVGLQDRMKHRPAKLSGGERQRVAIARALINEPDVLLADEPTGNLDADTGKAILDLFHELHAEGQTMVLVTHDDNVADAADRVVTLVRGRLSSNAEAAPPAGSAATES